MKNSEIQQELQNHGTEEGKEEQNGDNNKRDYILKNTKTDYIIINHKNNITYGHEDPYFMSTYDIKIKINGDYEILGQINKFIDKILPKKNYDFFTASLALTKIYQKNLPLTKDEANNFYNNIKRMIMETSYAYNDCLIINFGIMYNLGGLILYIYKKLQQFKIKTGPKLAEALSQVDIHYINFNALYEEQLQKTPQKERDKLNFIVFLKTLKKKLPVPPELIILKQMLVKFKSVQFCFEGLCKENMENFFAIILNFEYIFTDCKDIRIMLKNKTLFQEISEKYQKELIENEVKEGKFIKTINYDIEYEDRIWKFDSTFIKKKPKEKYNTFAPNDYITDLFSKNESERLSIKSDPKNPPPNPFSKITFFFDILIYNFYVISTYTNIEAITLNIPENYSKEMISFLKESEINLISFHFLDFLLPAYTKLKSINIEFNSLDSECFEKILVLLDSNELIENLAISFFSSKENYFPTSLYRLIQNNQKIKTTSSFLNEDYSDYDKIVVNKLLVNFEENIYSLFYLLKQKKKLKNLSFFCDSPDIITANENYSMIFAKLFLNVILYLNSKEYETDSVRMLFPYLVLDNYRFPIIGEILENVNLEETNPSLTELYFHCNFYHINNLENIISTKLQKLSLCQLDSFTFNSLCGGLTKYKFCTNCQLKDITLGLVYSLTSFDVVKEKLEQFVKAPFCKLEAIHFISGLELTLEQFTELKNYFNKVKYKIAFEFSEDCKNILIRLEKTNKTKTFCYNIETNNRKEEYTKVAYLRKMIKKNILKEKQNSVMSNILDLNYEKVKQTFVFYFENHQITI